MTVATNRYITYWKRMAVGADRFLAPGVELDLHVFTDQADEVGDFQESLSRARIHVHRVPPLGWPEATLNRYEIFRDSWEQIRGDVVVHLDADMDVVARVSIESPEAWPNGVAFVRHPGFSRRGLPAGVGGYLTNPSMGFGDARLYLRYGALGTWETSKASAAYVPRRKRKVYVCGGTWMGLRDSLGAMIGELAQRTASDRDRGVVAVWHDESHLNWYAAHHRHATLSSEYCFAHGYANLNHLTPRIVAVDKGDNRTRT